MEKPEEKIIRISKVLAELNISFNSAFECLKFNDIEINKNPNEKISNLQYNLLKAEYENKNKEILNLEFVFNVNFYKTSKINEINEFSLKNIYFVNEKNEIEGLRMHGINVVNIKPLRSFTKLKSLNLRQCNIIDLNPLKSLIYLENLNLMTNNISDYSVLKSFLNLKVLRIADGTITNFDFLPLTIQDLTMKDCQIKDISFIEKCTNLEKIDFSHNLITNLLPLQNFKTLKFLDLSYNKIEDISHLSKIIFIEMINLEGNLLFDLTPLYKPIKNKKILSYNFRSNTDLEYPPYHKIIEKNFNITDWFDNNLLLAIDLVLKNFKTKNPILNLGKLGLTDIRLLPNLFECTHLETLILSNHYAKYNYDKKEWEKTEVKNEIYPNNISLIPKELGRLKNLKTLIIGGDWKNENTWNRFRIKDISNIFLLPNLEILNISNNEIEKIRDLKKLKKLKTLHANNNLIEEISQLSKFETLEELFLSNNQLKNVDFLKDLENIKTLDLHHNKIESITPIFNIIKKIGISHSKWEIGTINIENNPLDEVLLNIANQKDNNEKQIQLKFYFERLGYGGTKKINRTKIIFLGNTKAGKTTISDILTGENKADSGSTHGINFINFKIPDTEIIIKGYDFGGQDYYHNLHHTFLDNSSLKLLVWGNGQDNECYLNNDNEILFPLKYWLTLNNQKTFNIYEKEISTNEIIEDFGFKEIDDNEKLDSEINAEQINELLDLKKLDRSVVVESMKDFPYNSENIFHYYLLQNIKEGDEKKYLNQKELKSKYTFITDFKDFCFFNQKEIIREWIFNIAKENSIENEIQMIDFNVKTVFESEDNQNKVVLTFDDVKALKIDKLNLMDDGNLDALLKGLHSILGCYYFNKNDSFIENKIIVNIKLFTDWIYKILNKDKLLNKKDGYFTIEDAKEWLSDENNALLSIDFILRFMIHEKLIFKMKDTSDRYFAPSYLPVIRSKTEKLFLKTFQKPFVKYKYESYFHTSILSEIISTFFDELLINDLENEKWQYVLWKNKVILFDDASNNQDKLILVEFHLPEKIEDKIDIPFISISKYSSNIKHDFAEKIMLHIESESTNWSKEILATNGNYIPYAEIVNEINDSDGKISNLFTYDNQIYKKSDFKLFLTPEMQINYPMKKVFISYSHSDINAMKELTKFLSGLERNGKIEKWTDLQLQSGVVVKEEIIKKLDEADIVILLISQNFISSDFIFDNELPIAMNKKLSGKGAVIPVYLSDSTIFDLQLDIQDENEMNLKMGNYYFTPQDENNNLKPIEEWEFPAKAWKKVYTEITKLL